jgi:hypothetical protein
MKKIGWLSFGIYVFYIAFGILLTIQGFAYLEELKSRPDGFNGIGYPLNHIIGMLLTFIGVVALALKALHMFKGWKLFSLLALAFDAFGIFVMYVIFLKDATVSEIIAERLSYVIIMLFPSVSLVSNLVSLKD